MYTRFFPYNFQLLLPLVYLPLIAAREKSQGEKVYSVDKAFVTEHLSSSFSSHPYLLFQELSTGK